MSDESAAPGKHRTAARLLTYVEYTLWFIAIAGALAFAAVKLRNWGVFEQPEHSDFAVYYLAALVGRLNPSMLYADLAQLSSLTGLMLNPASPYFYPPPFALLVQPLSWLPPDKAGILFFWLNVLSILTVGTLIVKWQRGKLAGWLGLLLWLALPSVWDALYHGNITLILTFLTFAGMLGMLSEKKWVQFLGGMMVGLAAAVKIYPALLFVATLWRRKWVYGAGGIAVLLLYLGAGALAFPWSLWGQFLLGLGGHASGLETQSNSFVWNQSLWAFWRKMAYSGEIRLNIQQVDLGSVTFSALISPVVAQTLALIMAFCVIGLSAWVIWRLRVGDRRELELGWCLLLLAMLILSPITWHHYLALLAPVLPMALVIRHQLKPIPRLLLPIGYLIFVVQRASMLILDLIPIFALSAILVIALLLWWSIFLVRLNTDLTTK